jgi:tetratricopeptide (TPR) repeat protein
LFWDRWASLAYGLLLAAGILAVYWPVTGFDFVNLDDQLYVTENAHIHAGITWAGLKWALRARETANWHPLTWVSHMLDCQMYGPRAGGHHTTSLLLHVANSWLLFALLLRLTGERERSFVVAALFAWHPLHVESVAWIAERKDVLSACFFLATLWAYGSYARNAERRVPRGAEKSEGRSPKPEGNPKAEARSADVEGRSGKPWFWYVLALGLFVLGLMSKPMLVTLPFVLLLLDYWPLRRSGGCGVRNAESGNDQGRFRRAGWGRLLLEKAPFLLLAALSCGVTLWAQGRGGAITAMRDLPASYRIANAILSYYRYIGKTLWPTHLAAFYPHGLPALTWEVWLAGAALLAFSAVALRLRKFPCVAVGWFWYVGMLVPVIGLVQVGGQAMADRYSYLPSIGLFIAGVFGLGELVRPESKRAREPKDLQKAALARTLALPVVTGLALAGCLAVTQRQVGYWRNSEALFRHAVAVTQRNFAAYNNLGNALFLQGKKEEALGCFREAVRWMPNYPDAHCSIAIACGALKRSADARAEFKIALQQNPKLARTHYYLANELLAEGEAAAAEEHYRTALALKPDHAEAHYELALLLLARNEVEEASRHYREAVRLRPDWLEALNNLSWLLATQPEARFRDGKEAVELAARAVALTRTNNAGALDTLAAALAEAGRFPQALDAARTAVRLARASGPAQLAEEIEARRQGYERRQPFREPAKPEATTTNR